MNKEELTCLEPGLDSGDDWWLETGGETFTFNVSLVLLWVGVGNDDDDDGKGCDDDVDDGWSLGCEDSLDFEELDLEK